MNATEVPATAPSPAVARLTKMVDRWIEMDSCSHETFSRISRLARLTGTDLDAFVTERRGCVLPSLPSVDPEVAVRNGDVCGRCDRTAYYCRCC
jgi:hypothetical protein